MNGTSFSLTVFSHFEGPAQVSLSWDCKSFSQGHNFKWPAIFEWIFARIVFTTDNTLLKCKKVCKTVHCALKYAHTFPLRAVHCWHQEKEYPMLVAHCQHSSQKITTKSKGKKIIHLTALPNKGEEPMKECLKECLVLSEINRQNSQKLQSIQIMVVMPKFASWLVYCFCIMAYGLGVTKTKIQKTWRGKTYPLSGVAKKSSPRLPPHAKK